MYGSALNKGTPSSRTVRNGCLGHGSGVEPGMEYDTAPDGKAAPDDRDTPDMRERKAEQPPVPRRITEPVLRSLDRCRDVAAGQHDAAGCTATT